MARFMRDSTNARDIPRIAGDMVAGYDDGDYAWSAADWAYHSEASRHVHITTNGKTLTSHVCDSETFDLTAAGAARWLAQKKDRHEVGSVYASKDAIPAILAAVKALGLSSSDFTVWVAEWTGVPHNIPGAYATQYDHPPHSGGHWDTSLVADYWPGIDPVPAPGPAPTPTPTPEPPPGPTPPPTSGAGTGNPVNDARAAMAILADALSRGFQALAAEIEAAAQNLKNS